MYILIDTQTGVTTMEWKRMLDTQDRDNDRVILPDTDHYVLYAVHQSSVPESITSFAP